MPGALEGSAAVPVASGLRGSADRKMVLPYALSPRPAQMRSCSLHSALAPQTARPKLLPALASPRRLPHPHAGRLHRRGSRGIATKNAATSCG
eukprot:scaffold1336_cov379-Prasinococcus_capsulatus_cf.AAC.2